MYKAIIIIEEDEDEVEVIYNLLYIGDPQNS